MAEILTPEKGNLYKIKETIEDIRDRVEADKAERGAVVSRVDEMSDALKRIEERCNALDRALPQGEKVFVPEGDAARRRGVSLFGQAFTAARRAANGDAVPEPFARANGQTEGTASDGGILVPVEVHGEVVRIIEEKSFARQICRVIPMTRDKIDVGTISTGPTVEFPTESTEPSGGADVSEVVFGTPQLDSSTLVALDSVSRELSEDALISIEPFLAELFAEAIGKEENKQTFSSTTPFSGVVQTATNSKTIAATHYSAITFAELVAAKFSVDANIVGSGTWVMHPSVFQHLVSLEDSAGRPIYATNWGGVGVQNALPNGSAGSSGVLLGAPVVLTTQMPTTNATGLKFAVYGDFKYQAFGDRRQLLVEYDDSIYFKQRKRAIMVSERIACKTLIPGAFTTLIVG